MEDSRFHVEDLPNYVEDARFHVEDPPDCVEDSRCHVEDLRNYVEDSKCHVEDPHHAGQPFPYEGLHDCLLKDFDLRRQISYILSKGD